MKMLNAHRTHEDAAHAALARLFSAGIVRELAKKGCSARFFALVQQTGVLRDCKVRTVGDVFNYSFARLRQTGLRNEYIYQSAIVQNVLLGKHSLNTASMLREFRVGKSRADVVILNDTSTVYEIKSERDTLQRLEKQLVDYSKIFARSYVVASERHVEAILKLIPQNVGVMCLKRWNSIKTVRGAVDRPDALNPVSILCALRRAEAINILRRMGVSVPAVPNTQMYAALLEQYSGLEPKQVHAAMVQELRKSRTQHRFKKAVDVLPICLQAAALMYSLEGEQLGRLAQALQTPIET